MMRHDESLLWEYAARELPSEDAKLVQHHLTECPECQEKLSDVRTAQGALKAARAPSLGLTYAKTDAAIAKVVERRTARAALGRSWVLALSGGLVAVGAALVAFGLWTKPIEESAAFVAPPIAVVLPRPQPQVESATGLTRVASASVVLAGGATLASGDVLRTGPRGEAVLRLADGSRLKLGPQAELTLTRIEGNEVALTLERGRMVVAPSTARRQGFVVHSQGMMVTVASTSLLVAADRDGVDVAVGEGRASVEPLTGLPLFVNAGQKVHFDSRWRQSRGPLPPALKKELQLFAAAPVQGAAPPPAPPVPAPHAAVVPASGGNAPAAAPAPSLKDLVAQSNDELAPLPLKVAEPNPTQVEVVAPPRGKPDMTGLQVPLLASPVESVGHDPTPSNASDWAELPKAAPAERKATGDLNEWPVTKPKAEPAPAPAGPNAAKLTGEELPDDVESIFLMRADENIDKGTCERNLLGLDEMAAGRGERAERARILRARCFDSLMNVKAATAEYRRYLQSFPRGRYADEAKRMTAQP